MGRARKSLVQKLLRAADSPYFELPKAWHVLSRYRTAELFLKHPAPPRVAYSDRALYQHLTRDRLEVKQEPLCINSSHASLATRLVGEQFAAMKSKNSATHQQRQQWLARQEQWQQQHGRPMPLADQEEPRLPKLHQLKDDAYKQAVNKLNLEITRAGGKASAGGYLEFIQEQEEDVLKAASTRLKAQQLAAKGTGSRGGGGGQQ